MRLPASGLGGLRQHSRTRHFSLNFKPLERRNSAFNTCRSAAPAIRFSLAPENQRSAAFRAGLFSKQKQNRRCILNRTTKTKPCAQLDATCIRPGDSTEIEDHHDPTARVQRQGGCRQRFFKALPPLPSSLTTSHAECWHATR